MNPLYATALPEFSPALPTSKGGPYGGYPTPLKSGGQIGSLRGLRRISVLTAPRSTPPSRGGRDSFRREGSPPGPVRQSRMATPLPRDAPFASRKCRQPEAPGRRATRLDARVRLLQDSREQSGRVHAFAGVSSPVRRWGGASRSASPPGRVSSSREVERSGSPGAGASRVAGLLAAPQAVPGERLAPRRSGPRKPVTACSNAPCARF